MNRTPANSAIIDVGSSALKYAIYRFDGLRPTLIHEADPRQTSLGKGHRVGEPLPEPARSQSLEIIAEFVDEIRAKSGHLVKVVATEAVRSAADSSLFLAQIKSHVGPEVEVRCISAEEEARFAYASAFATLGPWTGKVLSIDPGGSSNDFAFGVGATAKDFVSLRFGMNRLTDLVATDRDGGRISAKDRETLKEFARTNYALVAERLGEPLRGSRLIATSGAIIAAGAVKLGMKERDRKSRVLATHGLEMRRDDLDELASRLASVTTADRLAIYPCLQPSRAAIFVHGCLAYVGLLDALGIDRLTINGYGMKLGCLVDRSR